MPNFAYNVLDTRGRRQRGFEHSVSAGALTASLEERGFFVVDVTEAAAGATGSGKRFEPGKRREVMEVTRAMAALLPTGMPLSQALLASANVASGSVRDAVSEIRSSVERGDTLSAALSRHPALFPPIYIGLVRAGERSGDLDSAFGRLSAQLEREEQLRGKVLSAAIYPLLLAVAGSIAIAVLLLFVLPRFVELLEGSGAQLPASTAALLWVSATMRQYWPVLLAIPVGVLIVGAWIGSTEEGKRFGSRLLLSLPLAGTLRRYSLAARFSRLLGVLLGGGAPLLDALDDTIESIVDPVSRDDVTRIRARVREGSSLRTAVSESAVFPLLLSQLIGVGEDSGQLREFLVKAAEIFEERTERTTQRLAALSEPAMIVVFGVIVAFVALSLLQAIYGINAGSFR